MEYIVNHGNVKKLFAGSNFKFGYYAFVDSNGQFVIGEERGREGGELYRGEYKGKNTPWLYDIKNENVELFNNIVRYFNEHVNDYKNAVMCDAAMTDMEKLNEIFNINKEDVKKQFPQLYYAILAVLDKEKKPCVREFCASGYSNK
jgi:hypothetical protein